MYAVYKITNKINEKFYLGKSKDALKRFRIHIKIAKGGKEKYPRKFHAIHAAIAKYGVENFSFEIIHQTETEKESFNLEQKEIALAKANNYIIYNSSDGGEGNSGWKHTDISKKKMSAARKGKPHSEAHKISLSESQRGEKSFMFGTHLPTKWKESIGKLTEKDVREIKDMIKNKIKYKIIAQKYTVSVSLISMICHGKVWSEII